jgi:peptidyl-prolyl cis-trans isomerase B (cyclophilin B)
MIEMKTSMGTIELELDAAKAPVTVENFITYAKAGFYDGTIFHRVIDGFMIQGGGMDATMKEKETRPPIQNEGTNGLSNQPMTIAMARTNDPNSATSQFFCCFWKSNEGRRCRSKNRRRENDDKGLFPKRP